MDPFTLAIATFGVQKLRGKSTRRALRDAAIVGGGSYAVGASGILGQGSTFGTGAPLSGIQSLFGQKAAMAPKGNLGPSFLNKALTLFLVLRSISGILLIPLVIVLKYRPVPPTIIGIFFFFKQRLIFFFTSCNQFPAEKYFFTEIIPYK